MSPGIQHTPDLRGGPTYNMDESETPWSSSPAQDSGLSSPPRKRRRTAAPSITPRRFKRFFTPTPQATTRATAAGRTLRSLAPNRLNHQRPTGASPGTKADAAESQTPVSPGALSLTPPPSQAADDGGRPAEADPVTPSKTYATPLVREVITESYPAITPSISFPIDPRSLLCHRETHMQLLERSFGGIAGPARDFGSFPRIGTSDPFRRHSIPFLVAFANVGYLQTGKILQTSSTRKKTTTCT